MFLKIEEKHTDTLTQKHIISSNFAYLMANTTNDDFFENLYLNMQYLTSYLIDAELISINDLKSILEKQIETGINPTYSVINVFKGEDLIKPFKVFQLSNLIHYLDVVFYQKPPIIRAFKLNKFFYKNSIEKIFNAFFNIHKNKYFHTENYCLKLFEMKAIIVNSIENIIYSKDREIHYLAGEQI